MRRHRDAIAALGPPLTGAPSAAPRAEEISRSDLGIPVILDTVARAAHEALVERDANPAWSHDNETRRISGLRPF
jgi:hypothetical protein